MFRNKRGSVIFREFRSYSDGRLLCKVFGEKMTSLVQLCVVGDGRLLCRVFGEKMTSLVQLDLEEPRDPPCLCCGCVARPKVETERERDTHTHIHS